jgi:TetR/AcrR family transcriptional regulator, mexJK operon transcriptional repressor
MVSSTPATVAFRRGPGGRPTRAEAERRHVSLLAVAADLFMAHGLRGVSIDAIAQAAGVAKRFIYARYADKGELFAAAIARLIDDRTGPLHGIGDEPVEAGLLRFARMLLDIALKPETLALFRMLLSEGPRFPALAKLDSERNRHGGLRAITRVLAAYAARGEIVLDETEMQAELFAILILRGAQHRALILGPEEPDQMERRLRASVKLFLDGCRAR